MGSLQTADRTILLADASEDGFWDWNLETNRVYFSPQWLLLAGYDAAIPDDVPQTWLSRIHGDDVAQVNEHLSGLIGGKVARLRSEHRLRQSDGSYRWVLARGMAVTGPCGKPSGIIGTITDINAYKLREQQLSAQLDEFRFALASEKVLMDELDHKNRQLHELSITDGLTGLFNHRFLQERFDFEFKRVRRYGGALSCMLIDIDNFKSLNDRFGHQYGDYVLREISALIKKHSREVDICGRYGGEEFVVISSVEGRNALQYAVKLHSAVEQHRFEHPSRNVRVTVSIGVAQYETEIRTKQELIERADKAMYQAKNDGRNLIRVWRSTDQPDTTSADRQGIVLLRDKLLELSANMRGALLGSIETCVNDVEARSGAAAGHAARVARYAVAIAAQLRLSAEEISIVRYAALLHDIGKVGVPETILRRGVDTLSAPERKLLNRHPETGAAMLREIRLFEKELPLILHHHERHDGKGFPHRLRGREIPLGARIIAVADAYENLRTGRAGNGKLTAAGAYAILEKDKKKKYAPEIVEAAAVAFRLRKVRTGGNLRRQQRTSARGTK